MTRNISRLSLILLLLSGSATASDQNTLVNSSRLKGFNAPISLKELAQTPYYTKVSDAHSVRSVYFPEQFVIKLPNAQILSNIGMVITAANQPFFDYVSEIQKYAPNWKIDFITQALKTQYPAQPQSLNETIVLLASPGDGCYYHWMLESLPRLKTIQMSGLPYDKIYIGSKNPKFKQASLELLGIPDSQIICGEKTTNIQTKSAIIPSMPHILPITRPTWACDFIRSAFLDTSINETTTPQKKIYISRRSVSIKNSQRTIVNEAEVFKYLAKQGFEKVVLEDLTIKQQALFFNSAQIIIAAHGASLTNLVFCNSKLPVTLIEIYPPKKIQTCYPSLTQQLNQDRNFQFKHIRLTTSTDKLSQEDKAVQNIYVELDELKKTLSPQAKRIQADYKDMPLEHFGLIGTNLANNKGSNLLGKTPSMIPLIPKLYDFTGSLKAYDFLRLVFLGNAYSEKAVPSKKIYLSSAPRHCTASIIINEKELIQYLESKGFLIVALEELTIEEQAQLFNAAEVIVAGEGALLTNLIFCNSQRPVKVIEIAHPEWINEYYVKLTEQLNNKRNFKFNHSYSITSPEKLSQSEYDAQNILVEFDQLEEALKTIA